MQDDHEARDGRDPGRAQLRGRLPERPLPEGLENRIVVTLTQQGLLRRPVRSRRAAAWARLALAAAASVALFAAGAWSSVMLRTRADRQAGAGPRFVLLFYSDTAERSAEVAAGVETMRRWALELRDQGHSITGLKLGDASIRIGWDDGESRSAPGGYVLSGFFIVGAATAGEAEGIARSSPHIRGGGRAVVRPVEGG
jgi:hypothetical protein